MLSIFKVIIYIVAFLNLSILFCGEIVLSEADFLKIVGENHPIAKQAKLQIQKGNSTVLKAKGAFDPLLFAEYQNKRYDDKTYYELLSSGLKIPVWFGPDINFAYQSSSGNYLNPENKLPETGLISAGIKLPIGQGLFTDGRRTAFKQAEIFDKLSNNEQIRILAQLYQEAVEVYWQWTASYMKLKLNEDITGVAKIRFDGIKQAFLQGDIPAIDTLEAYLQIINFEINLQSSQNDYFVSSLNLSNYLWNENLVPLEINENTIPSIDTTLSLQLLAEKNNVIRNLDSLINIHPEIAVYNLKIDNLQAERQLKLEYLKPKLDLKYDLLNNAGYINTNEIFPEQNYKLGIDFKMPLFLRNERGDLQLADIKIEETELQQQSKKLEIKNKIFSYYNELEILNSNYKLFSKAMQNYRKLFEAEQIKFNIGESSLFLLNSRENSLLNAGIKQIEIIAKINSKYAALRWSLGILGRGE